MRIPTIGDVLQARQVLTAELPPTPMWSYPALNAATGAHVFVKHENVQPTGAFKVRGGLNLLAAMPPADQAGGVVGYSTGNHAQALAYAAERFGVVCTIVMPDNPNPIKAAAVRAYGAELIEYGANLEDAREHAAKLAADNGARLVSAGDEPDLIAGVATAYLEIFEQAPDIAAIVVPVGSGTGAAAACLVAAAVAPDCEIVAVQSTASPAAHDSWRTGRIVRRPNRTTMEGLATGSGFELTQRILRAHLSDFLLVDDRGIAHAQRVLARDAHLLTEGAGAAATAALLAYPNRFAGTHVAVVATGANASAHEIARLAA